MRYVDGSTFLGVRATCAHPRRSVGRHRTLGSVGIVAPRPGPPPWLYGQWQTLPYTMPINPVHMALLNNGKFSSWPDPNVATETNWRAAVLDLELGQIVIGGMLWDMFCNGMVTLPDGRVLINGGNLKYDPFWGEPRNAVFHPSPARSRTSKTWRTGAGIRRRRCWVMGG